MDQMLRPRLRDRLLDAAEAWSRATGRTLGALSSIVSNHAQTVERLRDPGNKVTDATLEKFAAFLADPDNWPAGEVAQEAIDLAHVVGVTLPCPVLSAGKTLADSRPLPACPSGSAAVFD
jgi:hypothetical protein